MTLRPAPLVVAARDAPIELAAVPDGDGPALLVRGLGRSRIDTRPAADDADGERAEKEGMPQQLLSKGHEHDLRKGSAAGGAEKAKRIPAVEPPAWVVLTRAVPLWNNAAANPMVCRRAQVR